MDTLNYGKALECAQERWKKLANINYIPVNNGFEITYQLLHHCTNRCMNCSLCAPYLPISFVPLEEIRQDIDQLAVFFNKPCVSIMGGEPLLHPDIIKILSYVQDKFLYTGIVTNIMPLTKDLGEQFVTVCKQYNIHISVSDYDFNQDKIKLLDSLLTKYDYHNCQITSWRTTWSRRAYSVKPVKHSIWNNKSSCLAGMCPTVYRGRLYSCDGSSFLNLNELIPNLVKDDPQDYINIYKQKFNDFIKLMQHPLSFCDHCIKHADHWRESTSLEQYLNGKVIK